MIRNEAFVYWNRNTRTIYFTNELGYTGLIYELPGIRKRPSKKFIVEKLKQRKNYILHYTYLRDYLKGVDNEYVEKILGTLVVNADKNLLWWRIEL